MKAAKLITGIVLGLVLIFSPEYGWAYSYIKLNTNYALRANDINDKKQIVGVYYLNNSYYEHGFYYLNGSYTNINYPGSFLTNPTGINNNGDIVGYYAKQDDSWWGFRYVNGSIKKFNIPGSINTLLYGINDKGQLIGYFEIYETIDGWPGMQRNYHAFSYLNGSITYIQYPGGGITSTQGINNKGQIVGYYWKGYTSPANEYSGFLYDKGLFTKIDYPGAVSTFLNGINDQGQIVGCYGKKYSDLAGSFIYENGSFTKVEVINDGFITDINNHKEVVGYFTKPYWGAILGIPLYNYKITYANGDYYQGLVYGEAKGYDLNYKQAITDEHGRQGTYTITGYGDIKDYKATAKFGEVYVTSYYDSETKRLYKDGANGTGLLVNHDKKFGDNYLGSECGYIIWGDKKKDYAKDDRDAVKFKFGYDPDTKIFYEADAPGKRVAILVGGGSTPNNNYATFYSLTLNMWQICTTTLGYDPGDVFVLAADGKYYDGKTGDGKDQNAGTKENPVYKNSNWSAITKVKGNIFAATYSNLQSLLVNLQRELTVNHTFYFWNSAHGSNYSPQVNGKFTKPQVSFSVWNGNIEDRQLAALVNPLQVKSEIYAFGSCYSQGMVDDLTLSPGDGRFAAWSTSWDAGATFNLLTDVSWLSEWATALRYKKIRFSRELGRDALEKDWYGPFGGKPKDNPGWQGDNFNIWDSTAPTPLEEYAYTFTFSNKDYYEGRYYASVAGYYSSSGYATRVAPTFTTTDQFGKRGTYKVKPTASFWRDLNPTLNGRVFVTKYYDADAAKPHFCTVFGSWSSMGKNFLKSEEGYINELDVPKYYFGFGKYEADDD